MIATSVRLFDLREDPSQQKKRKSRKP